MEFADGQRPVPMFSTSGGGLRERVLFIGNDIVHLCAYGIPTAARDHRAE